MIRPKKCFWTLPQPKKKSIGAPKSQHFAKISSNSKVKLEGSIENKSRSAMPADPKNVVEPCSLAHWGPKKPETTQKLGLNKKSDWKGA